MSGRGSEIAFCAAKSVRNFAEILSVKRDVKAKGEKGGKKRKEEWRRKNRI